MKIGKQMLLPFPRRKPKMVQMTFNFNKGEKDMKVNQVKFFRTNKPEPVPQPILTKSSNKQRIKSSEQGKKLDLFM